jgi:hypothetical protein
MKVRSLPHTTQIVRITGEEREQGCYLNLDLVSISDFGVVYIDAEHSNPRRSYKLMQVVSDLLGSSMVRAFPVEFTQPGATIYPEDRIVITLIQGKLPG